jgi:hypothetical protein
MRLKPGQHIEDIEGNIYETEVGDILKEKSEAYLVYLRGRLIDTVWFDGYDPEEARLSLINHDGYSSAIEVYKRK